MHKCWCKTKYLLSSQPEFRKEIQLNSLITVNTLSYKTVSANSETVTKNWVVVDAQGQTLGRMATKVAKLIRGKYKTNFTPHVDCGDNVIVINAEKVVFTGNKMVEKVYVRHTGYPGGQRELTAQELLARKPMALVEKAVKGMLPKTKLGSKLYTNLHVVVGAEHKYEAQKPTLIDLNTLK